MFVLGNFLISIAEVLSMIIGLFMWLIIIRALISWFNPDPFNPFTQFLYKATEPVLGPLRRILPLGPVDFSPILAFVLIVFLQNFVVATIRDVGYRLKQSDRPYVISAPQGQAPVKHNDEELF